MATRVIYKQAWLNATNASDYEELNNIPAINDEELLSNKTTEDIKITWHGTLAEYNALGTYDDKTLYIIEDGNIVGDLINYNDVIDKPTINGVDIVGDKSADDLYMYTMDEVDNILASLRSIYAVVALPTSPIANTMYYVGPNSEGIYHVYLYDSLLNQIDLGLSKMESYKAGAGIGINNSTNVISGKYDYSKPLKWHLTNGYFIEDMDGCTTSSAGKTGLAPAPPANSKAGQWPGAKALADDRTWVSIVDLLYPVGTIYASASASNPETLFGGTWEAWGSGKIPVGVDTSDNDFKTVEKTGGAKTHTHDGGTYGADFLIWYYSDVGNRVLWKKVEGSEWTASGSTDRGNNKFHWVSSPGITQTRRPRIDGASGSASSLQPYITCYLFKRTA